MANTKTPDPGVPGGGIGAERLNKLTRNMAVTAGTMLSRRYGRVGFVACELYRAFLSPPHGRRAHQGGFG